MLNVKTKRDVKETKYDVRRTRCCKRINGMLSIKGFGNVIETHNGSEGLDAKTWIYNNHIWC